MDIDIDFKSDFTPLKHFDVILASMVKDGKLIKHPSGAYFQKIPVDIVTGLSSIPHKEAEAMGYFKIDFLHLNVLENFENKEQIRVLLKKEPDWSLLEREEVVKTLFQIHNHFKIVNKVKPKSVQELADVNALIRPNKRKLMDEYLKNKENIRPLLYRQGNDDKSSFKRSHAISYALTIVLELHLIKAGIK